jgi:hypothetical protein
MEASSYCRFRTMGPVSEYATLILQINFVAKNYFIESRPADIVRKIYNLQAVNFSRPLRIDDIWFSWRSPRLHLTCRSSLSCDKDKVGFLRVEVVLGNFSSALVIDNVALQSLLRRWRPVSTKTWSNFRSKTLRR